MYYTGATLIFDHGHGISTLYMHLNEIFVEKNDIVKQGDSLNSILKEFYTGSGLDRRFIQLSIVIANPHAFAKNNPNFLFADKMLKLPSLNQIQAMLLGDNAPESFPKPKNGRTRSQEIYFIGG